QQTLTQILPVEDRLSIALLFTWLLAMIALPIALWTLGDDIFPAGITLAAVLQAAMVFRILWHQWGIQRAIFTVSMVIIVTWLAEAVGSTTGFPFGEYHYTDALQPQIAGLPLLVPLAWFMMLPPSWAI